MDETDCVVVGAGVVGLAVARALALAGREVLVLEREALIGSHTSSRNSEVIHAGIYYPEGSAKARLCVAGRELLYAYAAAAACRTAGSARSSSPADAGPGAATRGDRRRRARQRRRPTSSRSSRARSRPARAGAARRRRAPLALDRHHRQPRADAAPTWARPRTTARSSRSAPPSCAAEPRAGEASASTAGERRRAGRARAPGCWSTPPGSSPARWRRRSTGWRPRTAGRSIYCKGNYFGVAARVPFRHLIYPVPERDGLGVHLTLDMAGPGPLRPGHRVDRRHRLRPRPGPRPTASTRRSAATGPGFADGALQPGLHRHPPEARTGGRRRHRLPDRGPGGPRAAGPREPLRHREPRPHRLARHRRGGGGLRRPAGRRLRRICACGRR